MTYTKAKSILASLGITLMHNIEWGEYQVKYRGRSVNDPSTYFTNDLQDAYDTGLKMAERKMSER